MIRILLFQLPSVEIEGFVRNPRFDAGSAPCGVDETDRNVQVIIELAAEEIAAGGEIRDGFGVAWQPAFIVRIFIFKRSFRG